MDVSADGDWSLYWLNIGLFEKKSFDPPAKDLDFFFGDDFALQNSID